MNKRINIAVIPPVLLPSNLKHIGTEYKISKDVLFIESELLVNVISDTDLYEKKFTLDIGKDDTFYAITRYQYLVVDENQDPVLDIDGNQQYKFGTPSMITPFKGNQEGVKISDTIIKTPRVKIKESFEYNPRGNLLAYATDFEMFSSIGEHLATTWVITTLDGTELFRREKDLDNLTNIELPENISITESLVIHAMYHSDTNMESNYGTYINLITNKLPKYDIEMYGDLWVGVNAQFSIKLINSLYTDCKMDVILDGNIIATYNNIRDYLSIPTDTYIVGKLYSFKFTLTDSNGVNREYTITKHARQYKDKFPPKDYLDEYDYGGMINTNGMTRTLSYQLINNSILLFLNNSRYVKLAKYVNIVENNNLQIIGDLFALPVAKNIVDPSTFVKELLNGDVVIGYTSRDNNNFGKIFVNTYSHNYFNDDFKLLNSIMLDEDEELVMPGSIVTSGQFVYYIKYHDILGNRLVKLNPYNGIKKEFIMPINIRRGISTVADLDNNIYIMGGTNDDLSNYSINHRRHNDNIYRFNILMETFTKIGNNILSNMDVGIYQFHIAPRYGDNRKTILGYSLFNTADNDNKAVIANQSVYDLNLDDLTVTNKNNDHLDNLLYGNTIVLNNGDVIRFSTTDDSLNKVYIYVSDSKKDHEIDDQGNIIRDGNNLIVRDTETVTKFDLCRYDKVIIEEGGKLIITGGDKDEICYHDTLVITRDTVLDKEVEYIQKGYSNIVIACPEANLVFI